MSDINMNGIYTALLIYAIAVSVLDFILAGWDKFRATSGGRRIRERTLLGLALVGGIIGLLIGMLLFRHKIKKVSFMIWTVLIILVYATAGVLVWQYGL